MPLDLTYESTHISSLVLVFAGVRDQLQIRTLSSHPAATSFTYFGAELFLCLARASGPHTYSMPIEEHIMKVILMFGTGRPAQNCLISNIDLKKLVSEGSQKT